MSGTNRISPVSRLVVVLAALLLSAPYALAQTGGGEGPGEETPHEYHDYGIGHAPPRAEGRSRPVRILTTPNGQPEWIVIGPQGDADAVRAAIESVRGEVLRVRQLGSLGQTSTVAILPTQLSRAQIGAALSRMAPSSVLAAQHAYYFAQSAGSPRIYAPDLIGDAGPGRCRVSPSVRIGMIDGPVNTNHPALRGADVRYESLLPGGAVPSQDHGTAVAALLVGQDSTGALAGFAQGAQLHAISVFDTRDETDMASVERITQAIDRLVGNGVRLINLSLAGPPNEALGAAIRAAASRGAVLIAASGNERRPVVAWPAAAPEVIAVTAIDAALRRFRMANTGPELEFAAPGVDIYAARGTGGGYVSGTSFAAPIVTALAAREMAAGRGSVAAIRAALRSDVRPLGAGGRNPDFGFGLARGGC
ncbi:S8 family serine peptidase [Pararhodobacter marinus]|uniref:S8 family serine peptidase n=1 Tax=Pararhodobacter marinus TaxID=2184063 RepID=UPI003513013C